MRQSFTTKALLTFLGWAIAIVMFFPIFWMFITGFKTELDAVSTPPHLFFNLPRGQSLEPNMLSMCIQPDEGIHMTFQSKVPGSSSEVQSVDMEFQYKNSFSSTPLPEAYERLLLDAIQGDAALFTREELLS